VVELVLLDRLQDLPGLDFPVPEVQDHPAVVADDVFLAPLLDR
jgi:hypothetical protein